MGKRKGTVFFYTLLGLQVGLLVLLIARVSLSGLTPAERPGIKTGVIRGPLTGRTEKPFSASAAGAWTNDPEIFKALQDKAQALEHQKQQVELKEKDLGRIQLEIEGKINQMTQLQVQMKKIVEQSKTVQDKKTQHLAEIFCAMTPEKAARMIEKMEDRTVTEVFQTMRSKEVGGILTHLDPARAARLTANLSLLSPRTN